MLETSSQQERQPGDEDSAHTLTTHSSSPIAIRLINRQASDHPTSGSPHAFRLSTSIADGRRILVRCCLLAVGLTGRGIQDRRLLRPAQAAGGMRVVPKMGNAENCSGGATGARAAFGGISTSQLVSVANPTKFSGSLRDFLRLPSRRRHARGYYSEGRDIMVKYIDSGPFRHRAYVADAMQAGLPGLSDYISRIASNFSFD
ncbi:uncharacterized protein SCHCODRAFT_02597170 [Schizophyllum commune H4-8]|uniref:Uncharacterized protein n=1 Tax=Schizophyllum commune (strain H4-8 / FGSC 9210) TaxID=578458 RepID=D8PMC6_SCHCM|nr:uncharacterized protein SCHCODRAFT_02597170 [Schizophyllum commune H4-8]KAI5898871.1 hypothetical protein SCHCODRAFT_02597170 [Schizophyllum commune H4-8]